MQVGTTVKNYLLTKKLGSGAFSIVYKAIDINNSNKQYAIKSMKKTQKQHEKLIINQVKLMKKIKHKNVVNYIQDFKTQSGGWYIVLEYCGKGNFKQFLEKQQFLPQNICRKLAISVVNVLSTLHKNGVAHRDIKLQNILLNDDYQFKVADFGLAKRASDGIFQSFCGSPFAMAPQIFKGVEYSTKCDVWSLGIIIFQAIYGRFPFYGRSVAQIRRVIIQKQPNYSSQEQISEQCKKFIQLCLKKNPDERASINELKNNPWLSIIGTTNACLQFLRGSFNQIDHKVAKVVKSMLKSVIEEHIKKLLKQYKISQNKITLIEKNLSVYFEDQSIYANLLVVSMIQKLLKQMMMSQITIKLENRQFKIHINQINVFNEHCGQLQKYLDMRKQNIREKHIQKIDKLQNLQHQIVNFVVNNTQKCLNIQNNQQMKKTLYDISQLPLFRPSSSQLEIKWNFQDVSNKPRQMFNSFVASTSSSQLTKFLNDNSNSHGDLSNWIIQHNIQRKLREGKQIVLGEYISRIIEYSLDSFV